MNKPNILLIVLDSVRKDHLSVYGHQRQTTPNLEDFATDATVYNQAIATSAWTPPSHASLFTGKYPSFHRAFGDQDLPKEHPTVSELLSEAGYKTYGFSNSFHTSKQRSFDRGFEYYHDIQHLNTLAGRSCELSLEWLDFTFKYFVKGFDLSYFQTNKLLSKIGGDKEPYMAFINMNSAHSSYAPPPQFNIFEDYASEEIDLEFARHLAGNGGYDYVAEEIDVQQKYWELLKQWYDGEIRYLDWLLGKIFDSLKQAGHYDDTLIAITSDHGEHFGEHGRAYHQFSLYEELVNVPLLIKWPEGIDDTNTEKLISLADLAPTLLSVGNIQQPEEMQGRDIRKGGNHEAVFAEYIPYSKIREKMEKYDRDLSDVVVGLQAVRTDTHKLIRTSAGEETLYDISAGTDTEIHDNELQNRLRNTLTKMLPELEETTEPQSKLDDSVKSHLKEMGYM